MNGPQSMSRKQLGALGEQSAETHLRSAGYTIVARNWRCRTGEIDIVAMDGQTLVFVEVRTRSSAFRFGTPQESVDARKQRQIMETSQIYLHQRGQHERQIRFDVISVYMNPAGELNQIEHIRWAF